MFVKCQDRYNPFVLCNFFSFLVLITCKSSNLSVLDTFMCPVRLSHPFYPLSSFTVYANVLFFVFFFLEVVGSGDNCFRDRMKQFGNGPDSLHPSRVWNNVTQNRGKKCSVRDRFQCPILSCRGFFDFWMGWSLSNSSQFLYCIFLQSN